jgi:intracellular multiplication protein IcmK
MMNLSRVYFSLLMLTAASVVFAEDVGMPPITTPSTSSTLPAFVTPVTTVTTTTTTPPPVAKPAMMTTAQFQAWLSQIKTNRQRALAEKHKPVRVPPLPPKPILTYEQEQQVMYETLPESAKVSSGSESNAAFEALMQQNMPMTPEQVVRMRQRIDLSQRASAITPNIPPKAVSSTLMINLAPGATPPAIRLSQGYVSSLVFVDSTGTPWPIAAFDIGNPKSVNMQWDGKSNILLIQSVTPYISGDIVVRLVGLPTPITLELVSGQRVVDYRVDIHVSGIGPNTKDLPVGTDLPNSANQLLLGVLDGIAPAGSRSLNVAGASNTQVWLLGDKMYLRTRFTVLSPGWVGKMVSPDGMTAYELPKTSSVLISRYGEPVQLKVEGF